MPTNPGVEQSAANIEWHAPVTAVNSSPGQPQFGVLINGSNIQVMNEQCSHEHTHRLGCEYLKSRRACTVVSGRKYRFFVTDTVQVGARR